MKRKILTKLALAASIVSTTLVPAQTPTALKSASPPAKAAMKAESAGQTNIGERKFNANCGRCHSAPQQLSPSLTGTVVRHMRVRAILSAQDEKDILRYLAP
jgi:mono/diheme cytochrome c family protein